MPPLYGRIGNSWQSLFIIGKGETMAEPKGEILTLDEVAAYLKAGKRTVYRLAAEGKLPAFKLGGTWRFRRSDLDEWIAANLTNKDSGASD
jgi:excisionase family DNA binding protein